MVDDEDAHARLLSRALASARPDYALRTASNLAEARDAIAAIQPDLIFADLQLPDGHGTELIPEDVVPCPVVIMTSHGNEKIAVDAMKAGALDYIVKSESSLQELPRVAERAFREWGHIRGRRHAEAERAQLESELRHAQKMEAVGTLASGIAHDFNNLLTAILGCTELVSLHLGDEHPARTSLNMIEKIAEQATGVTRSLLTFAHRAPASKAPVDLLALLQESSKLLGRLLPASIERREKLPTEPVWVNADATQLQQVVMNLTVNARDAMPDGGHMTVSLERRHVIADGMEEEAVLKISDTGVGISEEYQQRIFEPFFTTKERGAGTGLGLSVVHGIVADHGGRIEVHSQLGEGSTFRFTLPICDPPSEQVAFVDTQTSESGSGELILIVEDNDYVLEVMTSGLEPMGYEVVTAVDGEDALRVFREHQDELALAILDLDLPKRSGASASREMRQVRPDLPLLIVTGNIDRTSLKDLANVPVMNKPFRMSELLIAVDQILHS